MTRWDAARARSRETPRKYVECGPVGMKQHNYVNCHRQEPRGPQPYAYVPGELRSCGGCGYHVCSCERQRLPDPYERLMGEAYARDLAHSQARAQARAMQALSHGQGCMTPLCGRTPEGGVYCNECIRRADAEAKPFRDAMHAKIKTLMKSPVTQVLLEHGILTGDFSAFEPPKEGP